MGTWNILIGALLGVVGMGYIIYGRNRKNAMPVISGIVLCIFPYFVPQIWITLPLAAGVMALPRFVHFYTDSHHQLKHTTTIRTEHRISSDTEHVSAQSPDG